MNLDNTHEDKLARKVRKMSRQRLICVYLTLGIQTEIVTQVHFNRSDSAFI